jgi:hypothetical protein
MGNKAKLPLGVQIIAWLATIQGLLGLFIPLLVVGVSAVLALFGGKAGGVVSVVGFIYGAFKLISPLILLLFAWGAFRLKGWAWWLGVIGPGMSLAGGLIALLFGESWRSFLLNNGIPILILGYLLLPEVREAFGRKALPAPLGPKTVSAGSSR